MIAVSYVVSAVLALTNLRGGDHPSFGFYGNWLLGLPWIVAPRRVGAVDDRERPAIP
jgi:hypothetical protein